MRKLTFLLGVSFAMAAALVCSAATVSVSNVKLSQTAYTDTMVVTVTYDLKVTGTTTKTPQVTLSLKDANGDAIPATFSGDVGSVTPGTGKTATWNPVQNWLGNFAGGAVATVTASLEVDTIETTMAHIPGFTFTYYRKWETNEALGDSWRYSTSGSFEGAEACPYVVSFASTVKTMTYYVLVDGTCVDAPPGRRRLSRLRLPRAEGTPRPYAVRRDFAIMFSHEIRRA